MKFEEALKIVRKGKHSMGRPVYSDFSLYSQMSADIDWLDILEGDWEVYELSDAEIEELKNRYGK